MKEQPVNMWIWIKETNSHNQHSYIALDDLSLEFVLEIWVLSIILCVIWFCFIFFLFDWKPLRGLIFISLWSMILWDHSIRKISRPCSQIPIEGVPCWKYPNNCGRVQKKKMQLFKKFTWNYLRKFTLYVKTKLTSCLKYLFE